LELTFQSFVQFAFLCFDFVADFGHGNVVCVYMGHILATFSLNLIFLLNLVVDLGVSLGVCEVEFLVNLNRKKKAVFYVFFTHIFLKRQIQASTFNNFFF
jgi:hypothetical protein